MTATTAVPDHAALEHALAAARLYRQLPPPAERRALRVACGLTQDDVAAAVGVTREAVARWEIGSRTPQGDTLRAYLAVLERLAAEAAISDVGGSV